MLYTDRIHLVADTIQELHTFCKDVGIKRCWYHGFKKGHPHYDLTLVNLTNILNNYNVQIVTPQQLLEYAKKAYANRLFK